MRGENPTIGRVLEFVEHDSWSTVSEPSHFADRLILGVRAQGHPLCLGLDPHLDRIPPLFRRGDMTPRNPETATAVEAFLLAVLERYAGQVAIAKPQSAFFEQLGWRGMRVLERVVARAHELRMLVLLDAKRGDIGSTARAYAAAYLDAAAPTPVDAITVNPYLGRDTLAPFFERADLGQRGVFVLVKTSNPGSSDVQDRDAGGRPLFERIAESLVDRAGAMAGGKTGWSSLGVVAAATHPEPSARIRELLPEALLLVPGYGAQGASARDAVRGFVPGPDGRLEGGIVASSRALLFPEAGMTADAAAWERAIDAARDRAQAELGEAIAGS
ncbi:MAG: orotidine-5'-phosphate decarboxylase [Deltaproteobacteria bacterium]|nr:MAG: orotidine-5'-phosphate decarboxylase [Deltaproteobacteria bacterium]